MKRIKSVLAGIVAGSIIVAGIGCNKSDTTESETTKTESSETVETVITEDSEVSEETEESDEPDETEMSDESLGSDGKLNEDHSYLYNCKYTKEGLNHLYSLYRTKAEEIYENSENKDILFGYYATETSRTDGEMWEYILVVYEPNGKLMAYHEVDDVLEEISTEFKEERAERILMPYEDFMDFPCMVDFGFFDTEYFGHGVNNDEYKSVPEDGQYAGFIYAITSDMKYAYVVLGHFPEISLSAEELLKVKKRDHVEIDGCDYMVTSVHGTQCKYVEGKMDDDNKFQITIKPGADPYIIRMIKGMMMAYDKDCFIVKIPIADDCEIGLYDSSWDIHDFTVDEYKEYLDRADIRIGDVVKYETGYAFLDLNITRLYPGTFGMIEKAEVKDGKIVQMFVDMYYSD